MLFLLLFVISFSLPLSVLPFGLGAFSPPGPLYNSTDLITLLDSSNLKSTLLGSDTAWMVEFYSSWCGHCQHFAPTFKELAREVHAWRRVIGLAAIDCAQEANMPGCREFEVMGYPSLKLIPPAAKEEQIAAFQDCSKHEVASMKDEMANFVAKIEANGSYADQVRAWPVFTPFESTDIARLWPAAATADKVSPFAFLVYDLKDSRQALDILLSVSEVAFKLEAPMPLRRIVQDQVPREILDKLDGVSERQHLPQIFSVSKTSGRGENLTPATAGSTTAEFVKAFKDFVWRERGLLPGAAAPSQAKEGDVEKKKNEVMKYPVAKAVSRLDAKKRRRYTVHMADLERTLLYSLSHEVAQHQLISSDALVALQDYVEVLNRFFPARPKTRRFLRELRQWTRGHDDAIRGEDLAAKVKEIAAEKSTFDDLPTDWVGCKGSAPKFGGYPCGMWTLWHALTVASHGGRRPSSSNDPRAVLKAMVGFVRHFFSCQECSRHFLQAAEDGKAIERDVKSTEDAVLWLWKTHNKVNLRLSGDITDDDAFPKEKFPGKDRCPACYDTMITGEDLWSEFRIKLVVPFLANLYGKSSISMDGFVKVEESEEEEEEEETKEVVEEEESEDDEEDEDEVVVRDKDSDKREFLDRDNFGRSANEQQQWGAASFFSTADVSLCFVVYSFSAVILILAYLKFVAKRKFGWCLTSLCNKRGNNSLWSSNLPYGGSGNPLLGKV